MAGVSLGQELAMYTNRYQAVEEAQCYQAKRKLAILAVQSPKQVVRRTGGI